MLIDTIQENNNMCGRKSVGAGGMGGAWNRPSTNYEYQLIKR